MSDLSTRLRCEETKYQPQQRTHFGYRVKDLIYNFIDHNSTIAVWCDDPEDTHYSKLLWKGIAHSIPKEIGDLKLKRIFSSEADTIENSDVINIDTYW
jgi:hypothetical protein